LAKTPRARGGAGPRSADGGPAIAVRTLLESGPATLQLKLAAGRSGLDHKINLARVQRPGLALSGHTDYIRYGRVQIMGGSELNFLARLPAARRATAIRRLAACRVSCFVVTKGQKPPSELLEEAESRGIPVLVTRADSTPFIKALSAFLEDGLALRIHLHSVLLDVFGLGVLIVGESGIGKSECALDLIDRGHRLIADDVSEIKRIGDTLIGASPDLTRYHMELRGLGVLNIKDLYGVSSVRMSQRVELVVSLERWETGQDYDRLGLRNEHFTILGIELPLVRMPVAPGRNIAILVEVASRNRLLKDRGYDAARQFAERVDEMIDADTPPPRRLSAARARRRPARKKR
jgi:HPr kinase/phosphorylase